MNYTTHHATEGLGPVGKGKGGAFGLMVHDTMAFSEQGVPLGLLDVQCWARDRQDIGKSHRCKELPIEQTVKSGCRIEDRQLGTADSLQACLAIDMVVAWRFFNILKLGREVPDSPCSVFFEEDQWKALQIFIDKSHNLPEKEPTLREAIRMVASLGGFLGRRSDGEPGTTSLWRGLQRLDDITATYLALLPHLRAGP